MADDREELRRRSRDANSKTNRKPELTQHIEQLDEKAQTVMARIDVHYSHLQQARSQNDATVNDIMMLLTNDFIELIDIKNEQIGLAIQAGKDKLVQEYQEQLDQINKEKDQMLSGQH